MKQDLDELVKQASPGHLEENALKFIVIILESIAIVTEQLISELGLLLYDCWSL